jgi:hypothetical protein
MIGFFEEKEGVKSNARLNSSIIIYVGLGIGVACLVLDRPDFNYLAISFVTIGFLKKVGSKFAEKQN